MARVGFVGTGNIGSPMAHQMLAAGHDLTVCDVSQNNARTLVDAGATWNASPSEIASSCEVVFTSLPGPAQLDAVSELICERPAAGLVHVDLSTISLQAAQRVKRVESDAGVSFIDCPVSGGAVLAARGKLTLMASGDQAAFERAEPILKALGEKIFYLGEETGTGTLFKLINNAIFLCAGQLAQEGLVLGAKAGLDLARLVEILKVSSSGMYTGMGPAALSRAFEVEGFTMALAEKDVGLALATAAELGVPMPSTTAGHATYKKGVETGNGEKLFTATLQTLEAAAGIELPKTDLG
jgi:3-hydroxyisobutyrate dehydrogenase-like beta-hydroxyacid dehydrogenase